MYQMVLVQKGKFCSRQFQSLSQKAETDPNLRNDTISILQTTYLDFSKGSLGTYKHAHTHLVTRNCVTSLYHLSIYHQCFYLLCLSICQSIYLSIIFPSLYSIDKKRRMKLESSGIKTEKHSLCSLSFGATWGYLSLCLTGYLRPFNFFTYSQIITLWTVSIQNKNSYQVQELELQIIQQTKRSPSPSTELRVGSLQAGMVAGRGAGRASVFAFTWSPSGSLRCKNERKRSRIMEIQKE